MNLIDLYPHSPQNIDKSITAPSKEYVQQVTKVFFSILLFIVVYLSLLGIAGCMLYYGVIVSLFIIVNNPGFITLAAGAGIIGLTVMFAWFMVKFIFKTRKNENPQRVQIFEKDHPKLFEFIRRLAKETGAPFPKKIYISPEVNACVFYNSSFLSLFFPVSKNLEIGLGLVNSVNMSEFKAVIAHEFGHFSQKSMKLGSYIYTVNHMLYNLVYEYDRWDHTIEKWAGIGGVFGFFAVVTFKMISGVRYVLGKAYNFINLFYMSMSRAMEYHADLVAVSVAGSFPMKHALRRIELSAVAYDFCLSHLQVQAEKEKYSNNIYLNHKQAISHLCEVNQLAQSGFLPIIEDKDVLKNAGKSRVCIKDQWASHPSMEEREANIQKHVAEVIMGEESPWLLFQNPELLQEAMTKRMYKLLLPDAENLFFDNAHSIQALIDQDIKESTLDSRYNGYYNSRSIEYFDINHTINAISGKVVYFTKEMDLFSNEVIQKIELLHRNIHDLQTLQKISSEHIEAKIFEFDTIKYTNKEAVQISSILEAEIKEQQRWLCNQDKQVFSYYYRLASAQNASMATDYSMLFNHYYTAQAEQKKYAELNHRVQLVQYQLYTKHSWTEEEQRKLVGEISSLQMIFEKHLKEANNIAVPVPLKDTDQAVSFREYILNESVVSLSSVTFDFETFQCFVKQITEVVNRVGKVNENCFRRILAFQTNLTITSKLVSQN